MTRNCYELGLCSKEDQDRIDNHWREVRQGLSTPQEHVYGENREQRIASNKSRAITHLNAAQRLLQEAKDMKASPNQQPANAH